MTQDIIDGKLDRRVKGKFGPAGNKKGVIFIDDLNMPKKEKYGAQPPIEILRQFLDQGGWYNRKDQQHPFRYIVDSLLICAMGEPGGGRNTLTPRFMRHLNLISFASFDDNTMIKIFSKILNWYFTNNKFPADIMGIVSKLVNATLELYKIIISELLPTPMKSHYTFNLRDFSKVITGICMIDSTHLAGSDGAIRLWTHEALRVFGDRLTTDDDRLWLLGKLKEVVKKIYGVNFDNIFAYLDIDKNQKIDTLEEIRGLRFGDVMTTFGIVPRPYEEIRSYQDLQEAMDKALGSYNDISDKPMNLVLFSFAIDHLMRIARILKQPGGNALLIGVGGSGRQSLTKLAARLTDYKVGQIEIKKNYGVNEWKEDMKNILKGCGAEGMNMTFILIDNQIKKETFLEDINNILNTGEIPNLFTSEEKSEVCEKVRNAARIDKKPSETIPQLFSYFVERCKKLLHLVLCFSPLGDNFRNRIRNFPSLVNCTTIDYFSDWPEDALDSVAKKFLSNIEMDSTVRNSCVVMVKDFHLSTGNKVKEFKEKLRRSYYVTPTSYLEMISIYQTLLNERKQYIKGLRDRYKNGYDCLVSTEKYVTTLEADLTLLKPQLEVANKATAEKIKEVDANATEVSKVRENIAKDEATASAARDEAQAIKDDCENDLAKAKPELEAALKSLDILDSQAIAILKSMKKPASGIKMVLEAVCIMFDIDPEKKMNPETQKVEPDYWGPSLKLLMDINFLNNVKTYQKNRLDNKLGKLQKYLNNELFMNDKDLKTLSTVVMLLAKWVRAMVTYYKVDKEVEPKRVKLRVAETKLAQVEADLAVKQKQLRKVEGELNSLQEELKQKQDEKEVIEKRYDDCTKKLDRARKLIVSLGEEKERWSLEAAKLEISLTNIVGDVLICAGLIAYLGAFTTVYRSSLTTE
jgi:dynein heavy chain